MDMDMSPQILVPGVQDQIEGRYPPLDLDDAQPACRPERMLESRANYLSNDWISGQEAQEAIL